MRITVLAGGVGSARFCAGLVRAVDPAELTIVVNTGDDERMRGVHVSPDIDTVLYHLAGLTDWDRGWGMSEESYTVDARYRELAERLPDDELHEWFTLGDRDLATNLLRTHLLEKGRTLSVATDTLRTAMEIPCRVLPMSDDPVRTTIHTVSAETLTFQEYFVRDRHDADVERIELVGIGEALPAPGVIDAVQGADVLIIPPSNPLLSVEPILALPGVRDAVASTTAWRVGISPIVGGKALKGPADRLLASAGHEVSPAGVARIYRGLIDAFVIDSRDADMADAIPGAIACDTIMGSPEDAASLAKTVLGHAP